MTAERQARSSSSDLHSRTESPASTISPASSALFDSISSNMEDFRRLLKTRFKKFRRNAEANERRGPSPASDAEDTDELPDDLTRSLKVSSLPFSPRASSSSSSSSSVVELEYVADGLPVPPKGFNLEVVRDALRYQARPGDVFVATYPKTGTTWTQYIVWMLLNLDKGLPSFKDIMTRLVVFLELAGRKAVEELAEPRIIKHHLPFSLAPYHPQARNVVIVRNPFDCLVSFYHHSAADPHMGMQPGATFDEFFEEFLAGRVPFGSYFDNVLSWYARRNDPNVFFFYYETLKERPASVVLEIAEFLDPAIAERLRHSEATLRFIVDKTSFKSLKESAEGASGGSGESVTNGRPSREEDIFENLAKKFFRKGEVGDFKGHLRPEQQRRLRQVCEERLKGTDMLRVWKKWLE
ncbi:sulfotransferase 1B1-like isoform X2 [Haemaphysalis longicornis]